MEKEVYDDLVKMKRISENFKNHPLWRILVDVVRKMPMYAEHKSYVREVVLLENPDITFGELSVMLDITLGESMVILSELRFWREDLEEELRRELPRPRYRKAVLGGTFNEVHYGHLALILTGIRNSEHVIIGVTADDFVKSLRKNHPVRSFDERVRRLEEVLSSYGWLERCRIIPIEDPYGPTISDPEIELLVVSPMTYKKAVEINAIRVQKNLKPLDVAVCPLVVSDDGKPISSTRIAKGEIDITGRCLT